MFSVTPGVTPIGAIVSVPRTPNSMMFNHLSSPRRLPWQRSGPDVCGRQCIQPVRCRRLQRDHAVQCFALRNSADHLERWQSGRRSPTRCPPRARSTSYNGGSSTTAPIDLILSAGETATAATFSPDQLKLFILTNLGNMYVYSTVDALSSVPIATTATDVEFSADGSFAYVAGARECRVGLLHVFPA